MNSRNKRTTTIIIAIIIMLLIAFIGLKAYIKGNNTASAASSEYENSAEYGKFEALLNDEYEDASNLENINEVIEESEEIIEQASEVVDENQNENENQNTENTDAIQNNTNTNTNSTQNNETKQTTTKKNKTVVKKATTKNNKTTTTKNDKTVTTKVTNNVQEVNEVSNNSSDLSDNTMNNTIDKVDADNNNNNNNNNNNANINTDNSDNNTNTNTSTDITVDKNTTNEIVNKEDEVITYSYVVNYLEKGTNKVLAAQKKVNNQLINKKITESAVEIVGYNKENDKTITIKENNNVINFYYTKKVVPKIEFTKVVRDINDKKDINEFIYKEENDENKFIYKLKLENVESDSYPKVVEDKQEVLDVLPYGVTYVEVDSANKDIIKVETKKDDQNRDRTAITWTPSNIGNGKNAKYVNIIVSIDPEKAFKGQTANSVDGKTVLDVKFEKLSDERVIKNENAKYDFDKYHYENTQVGKTVNYYLKTAGKSNANSGEIYVGTGKVDKTVKNATIQYASSIYNTSSKVNEAIKDVSKLRNMLNDFGKSNDSKNLNDVMTMSRYISGGLPSKKLVNEFLKTNYNNIVKVADNQIILWYSIDGYNAPRINRTYKITDSNGKELFNSNNNSGKVIEIPESTYNMRGIVVNISDLGEYIPNGSNVLMTNKSSYNNKIEKIEIRLYKEEKKN